MNFKWKSALFAFVLGSGIAFTSCSDDSDNGENPGTGTPVGEEAFLSLRMTSATKILTKAASTTFGEADEAKVKNAYLVFYDPATMQVNYQLPLTVTSDGASAITGTSVAGVGSTNTPANTTSVSAFTTVAQQLVKQDYKLLVLLNPTASMIEATKEKAGKYYKDFEEAKTEVASSFGTENSTTKVYSYIPMTNASGLINVSESQFKKTEKEAEEATDLPKVQVDRILAKVIFSEKAGGADVYPNGATLSNVTWQLDNTNKKTYWVRRLTNTAPVTGDGSGNGNKAGVAGAHENTFTALMREFVYAEDPNWNGLSPDRIEKETGTRPLTANADLTANFNFLPSGSMSGAFAHTFSTTATHEYVLENTMAAEEQWEDVTTRILIQGKYTPVDFTGSNYYYYGGAAFSHDQIFKMYTDEANNPWPTAPTGLKEVVTAIQGTNGYDFAVNTEPTTSLADPDGKLHFYKDKISYYYILIRHFDDDYSEGDMNYGRYGVVRNNMYKVTLNSVNGPGKPTIPDPEGPDDKEKAYISAFVEVLPWVVRTQGADI